MAKRQNDQHSAQKKKKRVNVRKTRGNGSHLVCLVVSISCVSELGFQPADLLLELVSLMFPFHGLLLHAAKQTV